MKVSVCMAAYNGAKYVEQQLKSIARQSRQPDEVILCDDGSQDDTRCIIQNYIETNGLQGTWKLYLNESNKGYPDNFYYVMSLCGGDIVFLSDQDDIWYEEKIAHMTEMFEKNITANVISCKLGLIDEEGMDIHSIMSPTHKTSQKGLRKIGIEDVFYKCEWPGMVLAYRRDWYQSWQQSNPGIPHDFLVCARAAEEGSFFQMNEILAFHRRHDSNVGNEEYHLKRLLQKDRKLKEIEDYLYILHAFEREDILQTDEGRASLQKKIHAMQGRYDALISGRLGRVLGNAARHWRETRIKTLLCDVYITLKQLRALSE